MVPNYRSGFAWNLLFSAITKIATPLIAIFVARRLGPEVMGMYMVLVTVMTFADLFRDAGVSRVYLNEQDPKPETERGYATLSIGLGLVLAIGMALASGPLARLFGAPQLAGGLLFGALAMALNGVATMPQAKLLKQGRFKEAALAESVGSVSSSLFALGLVIAGYGFWALASQLVVRSIIFLTIVHRFAPCPLGRGEPGLVRRIAGASGSLTGINVLWVAFSVGDQAIISKFIGLAAGGLYGTGKMIVTTADVIAKPLTQTVTVAFSNRLSDEEEVRRTLYKSLSIFLVAIVPVYLAVAFLAEPLVLLILGGKFAGTAPLLPALCAYGAASYIGSFAGNALLVAGRPQVALYGWLLLYVALGAFLAVSGRSLSTLELAWTFSAGLTAVNASTLGFAIRRFPPQADHVRIASRIVAALAGTTIGLVALANSELSHLWQLLLGIILLPCIYVALLGTFLLKSPSRLFSRPGVQELWRLL